MKKNLSRINILLISPFFYPHTGGSQQYMEEIAAELVKSHKDVQIDVLTYNTQKSQETEIYRNLNIQRIRAKSILSGQFAVPNYLSLFQFLFKNKDKYDLIYCNTRFFESSWWAPFFAKLTKTKIIITDHCAFHPVHQNFLVSEIAKLIDLSIVKFSLNRFDRVYATNEATSKFLQDKFGVTAKVIYGGVDTQTFKPAKKLVNKAPKVLFIGRMIESKGVKILYDIAKNKPEVEFVFAGPGPLEKELKNDIQKNSYKNISIVGVKTKKELARLLNKSDILVHPSYHHEGFPNVLTEAGASKIAVIATDVGGSKEIVLNNKTGLLIEPKNKKQLEDALDTLLNDKKLRATLADNLYSHVTMNFSWKKAVDQLYKEISSLI